MNFGDFCNDLRLQRKASSSKGPHLGGHRQTALRRRSKEHRELRGGLRLHLSCWGTDLHLEKHDKWQKIRRCIFGHNRDGKGVENASRNKGESKHYKREAIQYILEEG